MRDQRLRRWGLRGPPPARDDDAFRIVHTGTCTPTWRCAIAACDGCSEAACCDVDILPRSHVYLLEALDRLRAADARAASRVEVHLAGPLTAGDRRIAEAAAARVRLHGYLSHAETIALCAPPISSSCRCTTSRRESRHARARQDLRVHGVGTPILAAVPDGDARDFLEEAGNATVVRPDDIDGMAETISNAIERHREGIAPNPPSPEVVARFEYSALAGTLAGVFDDVLAEEAAPVDRQADRGLAAEATVQEGATNQR